MKFSKEYPKLKERVFTTIRKNQGYYKVGNIYYVSTPKQIFPVEIFSIRNIKKKDITRTIATRDADCSPDYLINMLEKWYGKDYDDFILITLGRVHQ